MTPRPDLRPPVSGRPAGPVAAGAAPARAEPSIRARLIGVVLSVIVPAALAALIGTVQFWHAGQAATERELLSRARALAAVVQRELGRAEATLLTLAASPYLESGDLAAFHRQARATLRTEGTRVMLSDESGRMLVNSLAPFGTSLPRRGDLEVVRRVFESGQVQVSDLFTAPLTQDPLVAVDVPVVLGGRITYDLAMGFPAAMLTAVLRDQAPPGDGWVMAVFDGRGAFVSRMPDAQRFVGQPASPAALQALRSAEPSGIFTSPGIDGRPVVAAFSRVPGSQWAVAVARHRAALNAVLWETLARIAVASALLLAVGLLAAQHQARRIARSVQALEDAALTLGRGEPVAGHVAGVREASAAAAALRQAAGARDAAEQALRQLNEQLEERIAQEVQAREAAQLRLAQAQRLEALGQLAAGIAHDFNNVLHTVVNASAVIRRCVHDASRVTQFVQMIENAASRGASITQRMLAFARQDDLAPAPVDPGEVIDGLQEMLARSLGEDIAVRSALPKGLPPLLADRRQLEAVLINLATNARDAMPHGGTITFSARADVVAGQQPDPRVTLRPGAYLRLTVRDTGQGMDAATLARVTEPFFTTKPVDKGTGLGLAMARGFAEQSGGALVIDSEPQRGTSVTLWLPQARATR